MKKNNRGFTLMELMIVIAVVAILAAIGYPLYTDQIRKSRRSEARQALADIALRQEKYRSFNATYATCDQAFAPSTCASMNGALGYYTVGVTAASITGTGYVATAVPKGRQADDPCGTLSLTMAATKLTKSPTTEGCW